MEELNAQNIEQLKNELNEIVDLGENKELFESMAALFNMPDDDFMILAPGIMQSFQQSLNNANDKIVLAQALNASGVKVDDLFEEFEGIEKEIDKIDLSTPKKTFLKEMLSGIINSVADTEGIAKKYISIPIELCHEDAKVPQYSTIDDAGADVYAIEDTDINPGETKIIPLGIKLAVPPGYAVLIHPRSGLSAKSKMRIANSIGLCDAGYRNEYKVIIENIEPAIKDIGYHFNDNNEIVIDSILHGSSMHITKGERIAQLRLVEVPKISFFRVDNVMEIGEDRGGGLGHSGQF